MLWQQTKVWQQTANITKIQVIFSQFSWILAYFASSISGEYSKISGEYSKISGEYLKISGAYSEISAPYLTEEEADTLCQEDHFDKYRYFRVVPNVTTTRRNVTLRPFRSQFTGVK